VRGEGSERSSGYLAQACAAPSAAEHE
jgi:hypothetical protein